METLSRDINCSIEVHGDSWGLKGKQLPGQAVAFTILYKNSKTVKYYLANQKTDIYQYAKITQQNLIIDFPAISDYLPIFS